MKITHWEIKAFGFTYTNSFYRLPLFNGVDYIDLYLCEDNLFHFYHVRYIRGEEQFKILLHKSTVGDTEEMSFILSNLQFIKPEPKGTMIEDVTRVGQIKFLN